MTKSNSSYDDEGPAINSADKASIKKAVPGSVVYVATAAEPGGGTVTYSLSNKDTGLFTINSKTGVVTINRVPEKSHCSFTVKASDASGHSNSETVKVTIKELPAKKQKGEMLRSYKPVSISTKSPAAPFEQNRPKHK